MFDFHICRELELDGYCCRCAPGVSLVTTSELYKQGKLQEAIDAQIQAVKAKPGDQSLRLFLFELFAFAGEFDRAHKQIDVLKFDEPELLGSGSQLPPLPRKRSPPSGLQEGLGPGFLKEPPDTSSCASKPLQQILRRRSAGRQSHDRKSRSRHARIQGHA